MLSVLVPYRPDGGHRDRIWRWLSERWATLHPDVEVITDSDDGGATPGQFNHPLAINRAAARARGDVFLIADCDTAANAGWVRTALDLVERGKAPWVLPTLYIQTTEHSAAKLLAEPADVRIPAGIEAQWVGENVSWAGLVMVPRAAFEKIGGYDERFAYWGPDDAAFGITMDTLHGTHRRLSGAAFHIWHPQPITDTFHHGHFDEQRELVERYQAAAGDPDAIRTVRFT